MPHYPTCEEIAARKACERDPECNARYHNALDNIIFALFMIIFVLIAIAGTILTWPKRHNGISRPFLTPHTKRTDQTRVQG